MIVMFFSHKEEMVKTSKSTKIITNSQQKLYNTTRINFCEPRGLICTPI